MATRGHEKYYNYIQFVTTNVHLRTNVFIIPKYCQIILDNLNFYRKKYKFKLLGYVIMSDHCHFLILPNTEIGSIIQIMHDFKSYTAQMILKDLRTAGQGALPSSAEAQDLRTAGQGALPSKFVNSAEAQAPCLGKDIHDEKNPHERQVQAPCLGNTMMLIKSGKLWQERFDTFSIFSDKKFDEKLNYIHNNPIRAGLVKNLDHYYWSSYQNYYLNNNKFISIDY